MDTVTFERTLPIVLGIERYDAAALYTTDAIRYRKQDNEIESYNYHKWIAPPAILMTEKTLLYLQQSNAFQQVTSFPSLGDVDYIFSGVIHVFEEQDRPDGWFGAASIQMTLTDINQRKIVWQKSYHQERKIAPKNPQQVTMILCELAEEILEDTIGDIYNVLAETNLR